MFYVICFSHLSKQNKNCFGPLLNLGLGTCCRDMTLWKTLLTDLTESNFHARSILRTIHKLTGWVYSFLDFLYTNCSWIGTSWTSFNFKFRLYFLFLFFNPLVGIPFELFSRLESLIEQEFTLIVVVSFMTRHSTFFSSESWIYVV